MITRPAHTIGLLLSHQADWQLLAAYLRDQSFAVSAVDLAPMLPEVPVSHSLLIVDEPIARRYHQQLVALKARQLPVFLPLLIVLALKADSAPWLHAGFDDVLRMPFTKAELHARLEVFLRVREHSEAQIQATERRFRSLVEHISDGIMLIDAEGRGIYRSPSADRLSGYSSEERMGQSIFDLIHPDDQDIARATFAALLQEPANSRTIEYRSQHKDGSWRWHEVVATNMLHEPSIQAVTANYRDITERKRAEEALRQSEARFAKAFHSSPAAMSITNLVNGNIIDVNESWQQTIEYSREEVIGVSPLELNLYANPAQRVDIVRILSEQRSLRNYEMLICSKSGQNREVLCSMELIELDREACILSIFFDITERKQAEKKVLTLNAELERRVVERTAALQAANQELEAFSYSVSHDLRAPLRAIDGFSRILLEEYITDFPEDAQNYLRRVRANAQKMGRLIDDLLAFARLSRQALKKRPVAPAALVRQCLDELQDEQAGRNIEISIGDLPTSQADPALLKQVWFNLLANALKYTRQRQPALVEVGCRKEDSGDVYYVKDNGAGFDMQYADKLFGVFQRLHRADEYEGTGVGLAIVQRIIHRHGGRVWAEAEVDRGAAFYFTLSGEAA